jgi:chorismate mutase/prephenate dehydratase
MSNEVMRLRSLSHDDMRREADSIDFDIHDLLMKRAELGAILADKAGESSLAPLQAAHAAKVLREILSRHSGRLPRRALVRIWSDILFAANRQAKLHVFGRNDASGFWDLARTHFGCAMPMIGHNSAASVVHACADDPHAFGIVPLPESLEDGQAWWEQLAPAGHGGPRIAQRLPFVRDDGCPVPLPQGFAIAAIEQEATGMDTTLLRLECHSELSRARLQSVLKQCGFDARILAASRDSAASAGSRLLVANRGFVSAEDERLGSIVAKAGDAIGRVSVVGGFADPFEAVVAQDPPA